MKVAKRSLAVAFGLAALMTAVAARAASVTYEVTGTLSCTFGSGPCPTPLTFTFGSTVMIDPMTGDATGATMGIAGDSFTGAPNTENLGNTSYLWTITGDINLQLAHGNSAVGGTPEFAALYQVAPGLPLSDLWFAAGSYSLTPTPEPGTSTFLGSGLIGLAVFFRRSKPLGRKG